ncbi:MAG: DUF4837 family protein [Bacteroidales bacterium]
MKKFVKKNLYVLFITAMMSLIIISCDQSSRESSDVKEAATGNANEIMVVMSNANWKGEMGEAIRSVYHQDLYTVPQQEMIFDLYQIEKRDFKKLNRRNRNVLIPEIGKGAEYGEIKKAKNVYSKPQLIVYIKAPDMPSFIETVQENEDMLIEVFLKADRDRILDYLRDYHVEAYRERLEKDHHVSMAVPKNYNFDENRDNFAWLAYETQKASHGYLVYRFGKSERDSASLDYFVRKRNEELKENVPGPREGSYMTTETKYHYPVLSRRMINNEETWIMEGLWKVEGDFMGGPFAAFIQYDDVRDEFVCIEAFTYDPRGDNRDQIRKMKAALWTMKVVE